MKNIRLENQLLDELRVYRQQKSMSQQQLAEETGLSQQAIARIESHRSGLTLTTLFKIIAALELEIQLEPRKKV